MDVRSAQLARKFDLLAETLDERALRLVAAAEAIAIGFGGAAAVSRASGLSRGTISRGMAEMKTDPRPFRPERIRRKGAGRKRTLERDPTLPRDLERLLEPDEPTSPLRWTCDSVRQLSAALRRLGHHASHRMVAELLHNMDYRLQANRGIAERASREYRTAEFQRIGADIRKFQSDGEPVAFLDITQKEEPYERAEPNTAGFTAQALEQWWMRMGRRARPTAKKLLIVAHSNSGAEICAALRNIELPLPGEPAGLKISFHQLPRGTWKWSRLEHGLSFLVKQSWSGKPPVEFSIAIHLLGAPAN